MERTWIVVCDASYCRLFMKRQNNQDWVLFEEFEHPASREKGMDLYSDRPGNTSQGAGEAQRNLDSYTNIREVEAVRFAHTICRMLESSYGLNAFERLILVAPPHFLGLLRDELKGPVVKSIFGTLDKDYTQLGEQELANRVATP
jgi:protein required for attachment to host cells